MKGESLRITKMTESILHHIVEEKCVRYTTMVGTAETLITLTNIFRNKTSHLTMAPRITLRMTISIRLKFVLFKTTLKYMNELIAWHGDCPVSYVLTHFLHVTRF